MEFFVAFILLMVAWILFLSLKMWRMNSDPKQQRLVQMLVSASQSYQDDPVPAISRIRDYLREQEWDDIEIARRMALAVSFVEHAPTLRPDYENVLLLWQSFKDET
jgi:hypothetical protein